jgi:DNA replication protein DnaC
MTDLLLSDTNVPATFREITYDDYEAADVSRRPLRRVETWEPTAMRPNLLLVGPPGLGKTMLAAATLNMYQRGIHFKTRSGGAVPKGAICYLRQQRFPVYFIQLAELVSLHIRSFKLFELIQKHEQDPKEYLELDQLLQDLKNKVELLVVDDVGKEHRTSSGFAEDEFDILVRTRYNEGLRTIYTTNVPLSRWGRQYSDSMRSLIERSSKIIHFDE